MPGKCPALFFGVQHLSVVSVFLLQHRIYIKMLKPLNRIKLTSKALRNPAQTSRYSIGYAIVF